MQNLTIHTLWNTGRETAPPLVQRVFESWEYHAPDFDINVVEADGLDAHIRGLGLDPSRLTVQSASDILRAKLLREQGGVWLDATCLLSAPLTSWLDRMVAPAGFFVFTRPGPDRLVSSWCMASTAPAEFLDPLINEISAYWSTPRRVYSGYEGARRWNPIAHRRRQRALADPQWAIAADGGGQYGSAPYFWFHYHVERLIRSDDITARIWARMPKMSAIPAQSLGLIGRNGDASKLCEESLRQALDTSPIHKLNWRIEFPQAVFAMAARS